MTRLLLTIPVLLLSLLACTAPEEGTNPDGGSRPAELTLDEYEAQIVAAWCEWLSTCEPTSAPLDFCLTAENSGIGFQSDRAKVAAARAGKATFHPAEARACLAAYAADTCADVRDHLVIEGACKGVFTGTLAKDAACITDVSCGPGLSCVLDQTPGSARCAATCQPPEQGTCAKHGDCAPGSLCGQGACVVLSGPGLEGKACSEDGACVTGLTCFQGVCLKPLARGAAGCGLAPCARGDHCWQPFDKAPGCWPMPAAGDACQTRSDCGPGALGCDAATSRCAPLPVSGPCLNGSECDTGTWCDAGTCKLLTAQGAACASDDECSGDCVEAAGSRTCEVFPDTRYHCVP